MHIAVAPVGTVAASSSKHVEWVDIAKLLDHQWRKLNMHQGVIVAAVRETLQKHLVTGKRSRDSFSDLDDNAERYPKRSREPESVVSGSVETRSRDSFLDLDDDTELEAAMTSAEGFASMCFRENDF